MTGLEASYAFEELVAELGAAFVCADFRIPGRHDQHASYIDHWLKHLKNDKTFLFRVAAQAGETYRFLMQGGVTVDTPALAHVAQGEKPCFLPNYKSYPSGRLLFFRAF